MNEYELLKPRKIQEEESAEIEIAQALAIYEKHLEETSITKK